MNQHDKPNAKDIIDGAKYMREMWAAQDQLDSDMQDMAMLKDIVETIKDGKSPRPDIKGFRSGLGWTLPKEQAALITVSPSTRFNNPTPENESLARKINEVYEPWVAKGKDLMQQYGNVSDRLAINKQILGRVWDNILPHPSRWAEGLVKESVDYLNEQKTPQARSEAEKKIKRAKAKAWPILEVLVPPRGTWTTFESGCWLPEVYELRKMRYRDIEGRWGEKAIPGPMRGKDKGNSKVDITIWANHCYCCVVIPDSEDPQLVAEYMHNFYRSPYDLWESDIAPDNDEGVRWLGQMFGGKRAINQLDEMFSDIRENLRDNLRVPRGTRINSELRGGDDPLVTARSNNKPVPIVDGFVIDVFEELITAPVGTINPEIWGALDRMQAFIERNMRKPIQEGEAKSGQSQNTIETALSIANKAHGPAMRALSRFEDSRVDRMACAVRTLDEEVPIFTDKGLIAVGPDDVEDWEAMRQSTVSDAIERDPNVAAMMVQTMLSTGLSPGTSWRKGYNIENEEQEQTKADKAVARAAIRDNFAIPKLLERLEARGQTIRPEQQQKIMELFNRMPPDVQEYLMAGAPPPPNATQAPSPMGGPSGTPSPSQPNNGIFGQPDLTGGEMQAAANRERTGVPQQNQAYPSGG